MKNCDEIIETIPKKQFNNVLPGEVFYYGGKLMIRAVIDGSDKNAVNLESGCAYYITKCTEVIIVNCELKLGE